MREFLMRLVDWFRRDRLERELAEEMHFHRAQLERNAVSGGLTPADARDAARRQLGSGLRVTEGARDRWSLPALDAVLQDTRYAIRSLARRKVFTAAAVATIALGIGFATSIYGIVDGVLLRPLPFHEPNRLVRLSGVVPQWKGDPIQGSRWDKLPFGVDEYEKLRDHNTAFQSVAAWGGTSFLLTEGGRTELVNVRLASATLLDVLDVRPIRGTNWKETDDVPGGPKVALIGYEEWQRRFGGSENAIGALMHFGDDAYRIIGVLPPGFRLELAEGPVSWLVPLGQLTDDRRHGNRGVSMIGRLAPGASAAQAELQAKAAVEEPGAQGMPRTLRLSDWKVEQTRDSRAPLLVLLGAVGLLLIIVCINVATLQLGEASSREQEMAARMALGAGRVRLVQQLLTESLLLSIAGSTLGAVLAIWGTKLLVALAPPRIPGLDTVAVDYRVLSVAAGLALVSGLLFGLAPALSLSNLRPSSLFRGPGQSAGHRGRLQVALVASQLGLCVVLLVGAGLLARSLERLTSTDPGFRADHMIIARLFVPPALVSDTGRRRVLFASAVDRLAALPGVSRVTAVNSAPFDGSTSSSNYAVVGVPVDPADRNHDAQQRTVLPGYFAFMGMPILAGRALTPDDRGGNEPVVLVNETFSKREFAGGEALGAQLKWQSQTRRIVGIVRDTRFRGLGVPPEPTIYMPAGQFTGRYGGLSVLLVRTTREPLDLVPTVRKALESLDAGVAVTSARTMDDRVRESFAAERFRTSLISAFGVFAAVLAALGMFGVTARAVHRRTREVGIRVALGAPRGRVVGLMLRSTLVGAAAGVVAGLLAAIAASPIIADYLYEVDPRDPATYGAIVVFLTLVALIASFLPARRAATVQPAAVLRGE